MVVQECAFHCQTNSASNKSLQYDVHGRVQTEQYGFLALLDHKIPSQQEDSVDDAQGIKALP
jgi:hypothetical protein